MSSCAELQTCTKQLIEEVSDLARLMSSYAELQKCTKQLMEEGSDLARLRAASADAVDGNRPAK
jgi:uncharacterized protein YlxW (UPF0749 family)